MDTFYATLEIGGYLATKNISKLITAIQAESFGVNYDRISSAYLRQAIHKAIAGGTPLRLFADQIDPETPQLRPVLQKLKLVWKMKVKGQDEHPAQIIWWHPGKPEVTSNTQTDQEAEQPHLTLGQLIAMQEQSKSLEQIIDYLKDQDPEVPPLHSQLASKQIQPIPTPAKQSA